MCHAQGGIAIIDKSVLFLSVLLLLVLLVCFSWRSIRMVFWKKWKRVRTRWRNLLKLGIANANAGILANSRKGYWRIAASPILQTALSNRRLERAEFQFFYPYYRKSVAV